MTTFNRYIDGQSVTSESDYRFVMYCPVCRVPGRLEEVVEDQAEEFECGHCGQKWTMSINYGRLARSADIR
jgi:Zn ribbon nucleic-acid-binding protein